MLIHDVSLYMSLYMIYTALDRSFLRAFRLMRAFKLARSWKGLGSQTCNPSPNAYTPTPTPNPTPTPIPTPTQTRDRASSLEIIATSPYAPAGGMA